MAIVRGDVAGRSNVLTRVHSECWTSEVLGSLKCDCREQLDAALEKHRRRGHRRHRLPAPGGPRHRPGQQDPRLRPAEQRRRHRRGQPGAGLRGRRAQLRHRRRRSWPTCGVQVGPPADQQPAQGATACAPAGVAVTERVSHWVGENQHNAELPGGQAPQDGPPPRHAGPPARAAQAGEVALDRRPSAARQAEERAHSDRRRRPRRPGQGQGPGPADRLRHRRHGQGRRPSTAAACAVAIELTTPACPSRDVIAAVDPGGGGPAARRHRASRCALTRRGACRARRSARTRGCPG